MAFGNFGSRARVVHLPDCLQTMLEEEVMDRQALKKQISRRRLKNTSSLTRTSSEGSSANTLAVAALPKPRWRRRTRWRTQLQTPAAIEGRPAAMR